MVLMLSGQMQECPVERHEYQFLAHGQAEQVGIRDLLVAEKALEESTAQGLPVGGNRLIVVTLAPVLAAPPSLSRLPCSYRLFSAWSCGAEGRLR